jgi:pyridinium-3,5-bisthiocarboxylic acid mononucleotide nickel chelatase
MRIGYLDCFSGISGDMLLGALVDAGVPFGLLEQTAAALDIGARLEMRKVSRGGLAASKVDVLTPETAANGQNNHNAEGAQNTPAFVAHEHAHGHHEHAHEHHHPHDHPNEPSHEQQHDHEHGTHAHAPHRSLSTILSIICAAPLSAAVKDRASHAFELLGQAEAAIHSIPVEQVHFHEVGAVDTIVDIVCTAAGCESLSVDRWMSSSVNVGSGTVQCQHGTLPVPAPATLALLGDAPVYAAGSPMERVTPTGAAILRMLDVSYGPLPAMRVEKRGYGAGGRDTPGEPNLLRLLVGEETLSEPVVAPGVSPEEPGAEPIAIIETVIDDSTPQLLAYVSELLLEAGAWDVFRAAVQMKKGRTGVLITVLSSPERAPALRDLLLRETTTIGLHWRVENKFALTREFAKIETPWGTVRIKIARWPSGAVANAQPEYEDCRAIARAHRTPLKQVMQETMRLYMEREEEADGPVDD